jgi:hypothetical protein
LQPQQSLESFKDRNHGLIGGRAQASAAEGTIRSVETNRINSLFTLPHKGCVCTSIRLSGVKRLALLLCGLCYGDIEQEVLTKEHNG